MSSHTVPANLVAGDTWSFALTDSEHSAPVWSANIYFENAAGSFSAASADDGENHSFVIAAATTATYAHGSYKWFIRVNDGTTLLTVAQGWIDIAPNPASSVAHDHRSFARKTLDDLETYLRTRAMTAQLSIAIRDRSISRDDIAELRAWRTELRNEVRAEQSAANGGKGRNIKVRFNRI